MHCDFDMAIGNINHVIGIDKRNHHLPVPITVMNKSIYEFSSHFFKIFLIMTKEKKSAKYTDIYYEITPNIIQKANLNIFNIQT